MKKLFIGLLACCATMGSYAQEGSVLLFGDLDFSFYDYEGHSPQRVQDGSIMPGIGFQFTDWGTVGVMGGFGIQSYQDSVTTTKRRNIQDWRAGGFFRYSHHISDMFALYGQLEAGYRSGNTTYDGDAIPGTKYSGIFVNLKPVISVFVKPGFALNFGFGGIEYTNKKFDFSGAPTSSALNITLGQQVSIGVSKNFGGHMKKAKNAPATTNVNSGDDE